MCMRADLQNQADKKATVNESYKLQAIHDDSV